MTTIDKENKVRDINMLLFDKKKKKKKKILIIYGETIQRLITYGGRREYTFFNNQKYTIISTFKTVSNDRPYI